MGDWNPASRLSIPPRLQAHIVPTLGRVSQAMAERGPGPPVQGQCRSPASEWENQLLTLKRSKEMGKEAGVWGCVCMHYRR